MKMLRALAFAYALSTCAALAQVGQVPFWPPIQRVVGGCTPTAVAIDGIITSNAHAGAGVATLTSNNMTVGSVANRALVVSMVFSLKTVSAVACTWDVGGTNQAMTLIGSFPSGNANGQVDLLGLVAPTVGNKTLTCTWTGASSDAFLGASSYSGVNQTGGATSFPNFTGSSGASGTTTTTVSTSPNDIITDGAENLGSLSPTSPAVQIYHDGVNGVAVNANSAYQATSGGATTTLAYTGSSGAWTQAVTEVKAACP